jgi:hypothetical protein
VPLSSFGTSLVVFLPFIFCEKAWELMLVHILILLQNNQCKFIVLDIFYIFMFTVYIWFLSALSYSPLSTFIPFLWKVRWCLCPGCFFFSAVTVGEFWNYRSP